jgi:hypothetical protein
MKALAVISSEAKNLDFVARGKVREESWFSSRCQTLHFVQDDEF